MSYTILSKLSPTKVIRFCANITEISWTSLEDMLMVMRSLGTDGRLAPRDVSLMYRIESELRRRREHLDRKAEADRQTEAN